MVKLCVKDATVIKKLKKRNQRKSNQFPALIQQIFQCFMHFFKKNLSNLNIELFSGII